MVSSRLWVLAALGLLVACSEPVTGDEDGGGVDGGVDGGLSDGGTSDGGQPEGGQPDGGADAGQSDASVDDASVPCAPGYRLRLGSCGPVYYEVPEPEARTVAATCELWSRTQRESASGLGWDGTADTCDPGVLVDAARDDALDRVNGHRELLWLPPLELTAIDDVDWDQAQNCALVVSQKMEAADPTSGACGISSWSAPHYYIRWDFGFSTDYERPAGLVTELLLETAWDNPHTDAVGTALFSPVHEDLLFGFTHGGFCASATSFRGTRPLWFAAPAPGPYPSELYPEQWVVWIKDHEFQTSPTVTLQVGAVDVEVTDIEELTGLGYVGVRFRPASLPALGETYEISVGPLTADNDAAQDFGPTLSYSTTPVSCL